MGWRAQGGTSGGGLASGEGKSDPEGQEPLSALHVIWEGRREKSGQKRLISVTEVLRTGKNMILWHSHPFPPTRELARGSWAAQPRHDSDVPCPRL